MSDIPMARVVLEHALTKDTLEVVRKDIQTALNLMSRKKPAFVAERKIAPLSETDKEHARILRQQGHALNDIARRLQTNIGRVSEAINQ